MVQSHAMGLSQIHHVQIITDAGSVRCGVILAEDAQSLATACGHLGDEGEEVVGNSQWVFTDLSARMSANGIEIAQAGHLPGA